VAQTPSVKPGLFEKIQAEARNEILKVQAYETGMRECISLLMQAGANPRGRKSDRKRRSSRPTDVDRRANRILAQEALKLSNKAAVIATWSIEPVRLKITAMMAMGTLASLTDSIGLCDVELRQRRQRSIVRLEDLVRGRDLSSVTPDESMRLSLANDIAILSLLRGRALHLCGDIPGSESTLRAANIALRNELALCNPDMPRPGGHRVLVQVQAEMLEEQRLVREMQARRECGNTEFRNVKYAKAYDAYSGALNLDPSHDSYNAILYCNRAAALMMLGLYTEAVADCDEALKRRSYYPKARQRRANALRSAGQLAGARSELDRLRSEMKRHGHHKQPPRAGLERLFSVDYRAVEQEYNEILMLLASEEERKSKNRSRASFSSGYSNSHSRAERRYYGRSHRSSSTDSSAGSSARSARGGAGGAREQSSGYRQPRQSYRSTPSMNVPKPRGSEDPYAILGVHRGDGAAKIKKAYHKLALKYHPDKLKSSAGRVGEDPANVFKRINEAYSKVQEEMSGGGGSSFRAHRSSF
jgi:tetratricopeptide (TPR) repeat protein